MPCPYCHAAKATVSMADQYGIYTMCRGCAMKWGIQLVPDGSKKPEIIASIERSVLESWFEAPSALVNR